MQLRPSEPFAQQGRPQWCGIACQVQTSFLSDNGPGSLATAKDKLVKYAKNWIPEAAFVAAHAGYRIAERSTDPREHGTHQFRFVRH